MGTFKIELVVIIVCLQKRLWVQLGGSRSAGKFDFLRSGLESASIHRDDVDTEASGAWPAQLHRSSTISSKHRSQLKRKEIVG